MDFLLCGPHAFYQFNFLVKVKKKKKILWGGYMLRRGQKNDIFFAIGTIFQCMLEI